MRFKVLGLTVVLLGTLAAGTSHAASIGPDAFGYSATDAVPFHFADITATGTRVLANMDDAAVSANIGFTFNFYGTGYTDLFISSNGLLSFGTPNTAFTNLNFAAGTVGVDQPAIAPWWDDLVTNDPGDDAVYYETDGAPGSRIMTIEFHQMGFFSSSNSGPVTFEVQLSEATGAIRFTYLNTQTGDVNSSAASATIGIRNTGAPGNNDFLQWSFNSPVIGSESSILFGAAPASAVPEPASLLLLGSGIALAALRLRRRA
jgi:hypothetical protein